MPPGIVKILRRAREIVDKPITPVFGENFVPVGTGRVIEVSGY